MAGIIMDPKTDTRNVIDQFKGMSEDIIRGEQEKRRTGLVTISINMTHDFNKSTAMRTHSGYAGNHFYFLNKPNNQNPNHPEGTKKWDKRGAVGTMNYNTITHVNIERWEELFASLRADGYTIFAIDNIASYNPVPYYQVEFPEKSAIILGEEQTGIPAEIIEGSDHMVYIPMFGVSPRSFNVSVSHGIVASKYMEQNYPI